MNCSVCRKSIEKASRCSKCKRKDIKYCSIICQKAHWPYHKKECSSSNNAIEESKDILILRKSCGLYNSANSCYMNAAIQCLSSISSLTDYIVSDQYKNDINKDNVLGSKGVLISSFASLLKDMNFNNMNNNIVKPNKFHQNISVILNTFANLDQHDAQDFLSQLIDGLHEDVNLVMNKPYYQRQDSNGRNDEIVAKEEENGYFSRNQSIIVDLMYSQFKSILQCTICQYTSITFDPSYILSLPIPGSNDRDISIIYYPSNINNSSMKFNIIVDASHTIAELRQKILILVKDAYRSEQLSLPIINKQNNNQYNNDIIDNLTVNNLYLVDQFAKTFYSEYLDFKPLTTIDIKTTVSVYEVIESDSNERKKNSQVLLQFIYRKRDNNNQKNNQQNNNSNDNNNDENDNINYKLYHIPYVQVYNRTNLTNNYLYKSVSEHLGGISCDLFTLYYTLKSGNSCSICKRKPYICNGKGCKIENNHNNIQDNSNTRIKDCQRISIEFNNSNQSLSLMTIKNIYKYNPSEEYIHLLNEQKHITLNKCIKEFTIPQIMDGNDSWFCKECKTHVTASKAMSLYTAPEILVIQLKRFKHIIMNKTLDRRKVKFIVEYPVTDFIIHVNDNAIIYDLFSIINHHGEAKYGHYTSINYNSMTKEWELRDDDKISVIKDIKNVQNNDAYILFYKKRI